MHFSDVGHGTEWWPSWISWMCWRVWNRTVSDSFMAGMPKMIGIHFLRLYKAVSWIFRKGHIADETNGMQVSSGIFWHVRFGRNAIDSDRTEWILAWPFNHTNTRNYSVFSASDPLSNASNTLKPRGYWEDYNNKWMRTSRRSYRLWWTFKIHY